MALTLSSADSSRLLAILDSLTRAQTTTLRRLSTGLRITSGRDDPAGIVAVAQLSREIAATDAGITNAQRADSMLTVADSALGEVSDLLNDIESLVLESLSNSGLSSDEIAANQAEIDDAIEAIDRIINTTTFNGKRLLDGTLAIHTTGVVNSQITDLKIFSRPAISTAATFTVDVQTAAAHASFALASPGAGATTSGSTSLTITGKLGSASITIASGQNLSQIATAINNSKDLTGVSATVSGGTLTLTSTGYGSDEVITVDVVSGGYFGGGAGTFSETTNTTGTDAVVAINGTRFTANGLDVSFNLNGFSGSFSLTEGFGTQTSTDSSFTVQTTGGATFLLGTDAASRATIGIAALDSGSLGGGDSGGRLSDLKSGGSASLTSDPARALTIIKKAIVDVATARGRIGGFQKYQVQTAIDNLSSTKTALSSARSAIADADFARETAELNRLNILMNSTVSLLSLTNQRGSAVLSLLTS